MLDTVRYSPRFGRFLTVVIAAVGVVMVVLTLVQGGGAGIVPVLTGVAFAVLLTWAAYWRPYVSVDPAGVVLGNVFRDIRIAWPQVVDVHTRFAMTVVTRDGTYAAWAAPAPGRHSAVTATGTDFRNLPEGTVREGVVRPGDNPRSDSGATAYLVRQRFNELRDAGLIGAPERDAVEIRVQWPLIGALAALLAATIATSLLG